MRIPGNFDRWMFNYKEGNLSPEEINYFENYMLNDSRYADDIQAWDSAYIANSSVAFTNQNKLIKPSFLLRNKKYFTILLIFLFSGLSLYFARLNEVSNNYNQRYSNNKLLLNEVYNTEFISSNSLIKQKVISLFNNSNEETINSRKSNKKLTRTQSEESEILINYYNNSTVNYNSFIVEISKVDYSSSQYSAGFSSNPSYKKPKKIANIGKLNWKVLLNFRLKQSIRKLEKRIGYPIIANNLRDPELILPQKNLMHFNPGFVGNSRSARFGVDYRNQWLNEEINSSNSIIYFDNYFESIKGGVGGTVNYSEYNSGGFQNIVASLFYSPKFAFANKRICFEPGIKLSLGNTILNKDKITPNYFIEMDRGRVLPTFSQRSRSNSENMWFKDVGIGFVVNTNWFYFGVNADNLANHDQSIFSSESDVALKSPVMYTTILGFDFKSKDRMKTLSPFLSYYQFGEKEEIWGGFSAQVNKIIVGGSYSINNEYVASIGVKFKSFRLNYQLDNLKSEFLQKSFVSHNIGIRFNAKKKATR